MSSYHGRRSLAHRHVTSSQLVFLAENEDEIIRVPRRCDWIAQFLLTKCMRKEGRDSETRVRKVKAGEPSN